MNPKPNIVFVFADQWRQEATGFAGNKDVQTPHLDRLAEESLHFTHAVSGFPVCCVYRASFLTGQRPLTHGVFLNDAPLNPQGPGLGDAFKAGGYDTAYIGKWHVNGHGRSSYIPPERRLGFDYFKALECTHDYNHSAYYAGDSDEKKYWEGYDAIAQTRDAEAYLRGRDSEKPFLLVLSWGPPHNPYQTAPEEYRRRYDPEKLTLRPNVPEAPAESVAHTRESLAGYYAHCTALDDCVGSLRQCLNETGLDQNTLFIFTSDHGDMLGSQGQSRKQRPWDESLRVPFLLKHPDLPPGETTAMIDAPDLMPTLLGLCGLPIPESVEGRDFTDHLRGGADPTDETALICCAHPFGEFTPQEHNGREYRGLRTRRYTYVRDLRGPWLFYDNETDPYQLNNLVGSPEHAALQADLDTRLREILDRNGDEFLPGMDYIRQWGYEVNDRGTIEFSN